MLRKLKKTSPSGIWYFVNGERIDGAPPGITGDLTGIRGDLSGITGDLSGVRGDLSGITGDLTGITGNLDDCQVADDERKKGVNVADLIEGGA